MAPRRFPISPLAQRTEGSAFDTVLQSLRKSQRNGIHCLCASWSRVIWRSHSAEECLSSQMRWVEDLISGLCGGCASLKVWKTRINRELLFHLLRWVKGHAFVVFQSALWVYEWQQWLKSSSFQIYIFYYYYLKTTCSGKRKPKSALILESKGLFKPCKNYIIFTPKLFSPMLNLSNLSIKEQLIFPVWYFWFILYVFRPL